MVATIFAVIKSKSKKADTVLFHYLMENEELEWNTLPGFDNALWLDIPLHFFLAITDTTTKTVTAAFKNLLKDYRDKIDGMFLCTYDEAIPYILYEQFGYPQRKIEFCNLENTLDVEFLTTVLENSKLYPLTGINPKDSSIWSTTNHIAVIIDSKAPFHLKCRYKFYLNGKFVEEYPSMTLKGIASKKIVNILKERGAKPRDIEHIIGKTESKALPFKHTHQ